MLCNVRDVPVPSYTGYIMQTAKWAIIKYMCRAYTPKCYVICEMYLFSHTDYIIQTARWATKTYVPSLLIKMLCNVRDVPVFSSYTGYIMQTAKWAIVKYMCRAYTPKCYVICEMYLLPHIQTTSCKQPKRAIDKMCRVIHQKDTI